MSACVNCGSIETELRRGDDGHFRKFCDDCPHIGGPYISSHDRADDPVQDDVDEATDKTQSLDDFLTS